MVHVPSYIATHATEGVGRNRLHSLLYSRLVTEAAHIRDEFLLRGDVVFLNHGSFGACPRPVFERYQAWQRELESQPVEFVGRRVTGLLAEAREALAEF